MNTEEVTALLLQICAGDVDAFAKLYKAYAPSVKAFVLRTLRDSERGAADDIVSETFLALWRSAAKFQAQSAFRTWLFGIAKYKSLEWRRKTGSRETTVDIEEFEQAPDISVDADVFRWVARKQLAGSLDACLEKLSTDQRTTLYLTHVEEMTQGEVAEIMAVSVNTVKSRLRLAVERVRHCLARTGRNEAQGTSKDARDER